MGGSKPLMNIQDTLIVWVLDEEAWNWNLEFLNPWEKRLKLNSWEWGWLLYMITDQE